MGCWQANVRNAARDNIELDTSFVLDVTRHAHATDAQMPATQAHTFLGPSAVELPSQQATERRRIQGNSTETLGTRWPKAVVRPSTTNNRTWSKWPTPSVHVRSPSC